MYPAKGPSPSAEYLAAGSLSAAMEPCVFCFSVVAAAEPGAMPRVLEFFAKRNLVPLRWISQLTGPGERELSMDIQVAGLTPDVGHYIARCINQLHDVRLVLTSEKAAA